MLGKAIALASESFKNKKDQGGQPYILHCLRVMQAMPDKDEELRCIAVLHDILEDCPEVTTLTLVSEGFNNRVIEGVKALTHDKSVPYEDYINMLYFNQDARKVKLADLEDNSRITRMKDLRKKDFLRLEKYFKAYKYLQE